jgi:hypothetical protein
MTGSNEEVVWNGGMDNVSWKEVCASNVTAVAY